MTDTDTSLDTDTQIHIKFPRKWTVTIFNDDYTPIDFVVDVIRHNFQMDESEANAIAIKIHDEGKANVGEFSRDIAETKALIITQAAVFHQHPLKVEATPL
jgi:ATP-dependent Clp protease adaptor protein ClpS